MAWFVRVSDEWVVSDLDDGAFRLLCLVAKYARKTGVCELGTTDLGRVLRVSARQIQRRLATLEEKGYIHRQYQSEAGNRLAGIELADSPARTAPSPSPVPDKNVRPAGHPRPTPMSVMTPVSDTRVGHPCPAPLKEKREQEHERAGRQAGPPDARLVRPTRTVERSPDPAARASQVRELARSFWDERVAAELDLYVATGGEVDWAALEYAVRVTAEDRDRRRMTIRKPYGFIMTEYRKHYLQELPSGPVEPRVAPAPNRGKYELFLDTFKRKAGLIS